MSKAIQHISRHTKKAGRHLWDHFIPHAGNNYHPHALKHNVLIGYSVILILLKVLVVVVPIALPSSSLFSSAITPQNIVELTNQTRENLSLGDLKLNDKLTASAQAKAEDMLLNQYFAHTSPAGATPWDWFAKAGYKYTYAGENLAVHFTTAENLQAGWLASPTHRANIVMPKYTEIGVGVAMGTFEGFDTTIVVEHFASPIKTALATTIKPVTKEVVAPVINANTNTPAPKPVLEPVTAGSTTGEVESAVIVPKTPVSAVAKPVPVVLKPIIDESSLKVLQDNNSYQVQIKVTNAKAVVVRLVAEAVVLIKQNNDVWQGSIAFNPDQFSKGGELLSAMVIGSDDSVDTKSLVWLAPKVSTQQFYVFNEGTNKFAKILGFFTVRNLDDSVTQFYFYFVVFLVAALLLNIFIKIRVQHVSVVSHSLAVVGLALLLTII
jgi:hypothetical protein